MKLDPLVANHLSSEILKSEEIALSLLPTNEEDEIDPKGKEQIEKLYASIQGYLQARARGENEQYLGTSFMIHHKLPFNGWCERIGAHPELKETAKAIQDELTLALKLACSEEWTTRENIINSNDRTR